MRSDFSLNTLRSHLLRICIASLMIFAVRNAKYDRSGEIDDSGGKHAARVDGNPAHVQ